jgi:hypothetical protein
MAHLALKVLLVQTAWTVQLVLKVPAVRKGLKVRWVRKDRKVHQALAVHSLGVASDVLVSSGGP